MILCLTPTSSPSSVHWRIRASSFAMAIAAELGQSFSATDRSPCKNECTQSSCKLEYSSRSRREPIAISSNAGRVVDTQPNANNIQVSLCFYSFGQVPKRASKPLAHCSSPKMCNLSHVPNMVINPLSLRQHPTAKTILARTQCSTYFRCHLHGPDIHSRLFRTSSSGQSSPQSSFGSLTCSSRTSSSTQSPPSSQSSLADLSTISPIPFTRPQPRIQVASLLSDARAR